MGLAQYLKETRNELHHVAWPTRVQTVVYTILVIAISVLVSLYLGFFDFLFTNGLGKAVEMLPQQSAQQLPLNNLLISTTTTTTASTTPKQK